MAKIRFATKEIESHVPVGIDLLAAAAIRPQLPFKFGCRRGECGVCAIKVNQGSQNLTKMSALEQNVLIKKGHAKDIYRLACQCALNGDIEIDSAD